MELTVLACAAHSRARYGRRVLIANVLNMAVADGCAFVLLQQDLDATPDIYAFDLLSGQLTLCAPGVNAKYLMGVLGGSPVVAEVVENQTVAWLVTQPEHRVVIPSAYQVWQTTSAIVCSPVAEEGQWVASQLLLVDGRLGVERTVAGISAPQTFDLQDAAFAARRLPLWCQSLHIDLHPLLDSNASGMNVLLSSDSTGNQVFYQLGSALVDGRTGTIVWHNYKALWALRGEWRPSVAWTPETHAALAPVDRARALALLLCTRQHAHHLPQRLVLRVIACVMDA